MNDIFGCFFSVSVVCYPRVLIFLLIIPRLHSVASFRWCIVLSDARRLFRFVICVPYFGGFFWWVVYLRDVGV